MELAKTNDYASPRKQVSNNLHNHLSKIECKKSEQRTVSL